MGSPSCQIASGGAIGTGAKIEVRGIGFRPKVIHILNLTSGDEGDWVESMTADTVFKRKGADGVGALISTATHGITQQADGFDIGVDADINASGEILKWACWG